MITVEEALEKVLDCVQVLSREEKRNWISDEATTTLARRGIPPVLTASMETAMKADVAS